MFFVSKANRNKERKITGHLYLSCNMVVACTETCIQYSTVLIVATHETPV